MVWQIAFSKGGFRNLTCAMCSSTVWPCHSPIKSWSLNCPPLESGWACDCMDRSRASMTEAASHVMPHPKSLSIIKSLFSASTFWGNLLLSTTIVTQMHGYKESLGIWALFWAVLCQANIWRCRRTNSGSNNRCLPQCLTPFPPGMTEEKVLLPQTLTRAIFQSSILYFVFQNAIIPFRRFTVWSMVDGSVINHNARVTWLSFF